MKHFLRNETGAVAVEMALLFPFFILVMWFGSEAAYHYRLENSLHRATASLTEIVANTPLDPAQNDSEAETLPDRLPVLLEPALTALRQMMGADAETQLGLRLSYYRTPVPHTIDLPAPPLVLSVGLACPESTLPLLDALASQGIITADNVAKTELVRIESCYQGQERWALGEWVFPKNFTSNYITLRKDW